MSSFRQFLAENKIWWILPIVIVVGIVGYVAVFGAQPESVPGEDGSFNYDQY